MIVYCCERFAAIDSKEVSDYEARAIEADASNRPRGQRSLSMMGWGPSPVLISKGQDGSGDPSYEAYCLILEVPATATLWR